MQILIYFEDMVTELLSIAAILSAIVLVICLLIITISTCKNDKVKREAYKEITRKAISKNSNIKMEM